MLWVLLAPRLCWCFWPMMYLQPFIHSVVSFLWVKLSSSLYKYTIPQLVLQEFRRMLLLVIFENFYLFLQSYFTSSFNNEMQEWGPHLILIQLPTVGLREFHLLNGSIRSWELQTQTCEPATGSRRESSPVGKRNKHFFKKGNVAYSHSMCKLKCCSHRSKE